MRLYVFQLSLIISYFLALVNIKKLIYLLDCEKKFLYY